MVAMISSKRLLEMAKKWRKFASIGRKRMILSRSDSGVGDADMLADKGHFVVYSEDGARFVVPLLYLNCPIFRELLKMAEDEFGLMGDRPITLPGDAAFLDYIVSTLRRRDLPKDMENALLVSISTTCRTSSSSFSSFPSGGNKYTCQQTLLLQGF